MIWQAHVMNKIRHTLSYLQAGGSVYYTIVCRKWIAHVVKLRCWVILVLNWFISHMKFSNPEINDRNQSIFLSELLDSDFAEFNVIKTPRAPFEN